MAKNDITAPTCETRYIEMASKRKIQMPAPARAGLSLLIVGAIFVGLGNYTHRGGFYLYGLPMVIAGFLLYMISSIIIARKRPSSN